MTRITVFLTDQQVALVHQLAKEAGLKFAEVLRRLIDDALAARKREAEH